MILKPTPEMSEQAHRPGKAVRRVEWIWPFYRIAAAQCSLFRQTIQAGVAKNYYLAT